ncbi:putative serine/threonine-protein kinase-like protein CCR3 [Macadamia integrifolia]|uniref:putative serine/threonine-protein kinase-like protein CCR3 n=1 Tax=Macadamia integrifolia TaxID=60698 RepID=UPI001C530C2C|nr:putative serine/threonine-protein kinase-like protein CCR3 [Macadamia integrifolia]
MTRVSSCVILVVFFITFVFPSVCFGLGSASTLSISYGSGTVCGILAGNSTQRIQCYRGGQTILIYPDVSFQVISGGRNFFCGLSWDGSILLCWDTSFEAKRVYYNSSVRLRDVTVGDDQVCAVTVETQVAICWRGIGNRFPSPMNQQFQAITSGIGFSCGILSSNSKVLCWGIDNETAQEIQNQFGNISMDSLVAGGSHACGLNIDGFIICKGRNDSGQLEVPENSSFYFSELALGFNHSCATRRSDGSVVCWGGGGQFSSNVTNGVSFQLISAGSNFTCGLASINLSVICWGPGSSSIYLPLPQIVPGPCTVTNCSCGQYPGSFCSGSRIICRTCLQEPSPPPPPAALPPPPPPPASRSPSSKKARDRGLLAFMIVGSVGCFAGLCTIAYCLWIGECCCRRKKIHNSVQPTITGGDANAGGNGSGDIFSSLSRSSTIRRQCSRAMRRQRSGPSSKHTDRAEEFSLAELAVATNNFCLGNKIGAGSFGIVYQGKLGDGREVAIKRGEIGSTKTKKFQEKESAFESEIAFLSRLHHKHLVRLVGFCEEKDERLLVYDYMKNGALHDHLHSNNNVEKISSVLNSWKMRIKILLDAARGIEYLHNYAVPPIIHRDIKSSNILLDMNWTARVSDFGLSLMGPESPTEEYKSTKAAGTVGYMDPEYYGLNVLTAKSDVYGLGVVLLEILTGKKAIFKDAGGPTSVVDYAVPKILNGELESVLDVRVGPPEAHEAEAVELVAYTAVHCVNLEGRERPTMTDIVANLERAFSLCDDSHGSISSATISIASD